MLATQVQSPLLLDVRPVFLPEQVPTVVKSRTAYRQHVTWMGVPILQKCGRQKHPAQPAYRWLGLKVAYMFSTGMWGLLMLTGGLSFEQVTLAIPRWLDTNIGELPTSLLLVHLGGLGA